MPKRNRTVKTMERYGGAAKRREVIKQAASDRERGLANTDCRVRDQTSDKYCARPARKTR